jgi:ABC-type antimicrobial peptide transport system permease subunit
MGLDDTVGDGMEWYFPYNPKQQPGSFAFVVRAPTSAATTIEHVRGRIRQMDPKLPITISTMDARVAASVWRPRFFLRLVIAFGIAGALLATVGVYATSASWASQRMRDFALRLALGATGREVAALVLRHALATGVLGASVGLIAALAILRQLEPLLFATSPSDAGALFVAALAVTVIILAASGISAIRSARLDPISILRGD